MKASSQIINSATNINCPYLLLGLMGFSTDGDRNTKNAVRPLITAIPEEAAAKLAG